MLSFLFFVVFIPVTLVIILGVVSAKQERRAQEGMSLSQLEAHLRKREQGAQRVREQSLRWAHGPLNQMILCPHCGEKGHTHTKPVRAKKGISGAKATGAILTGGVSLLATGLSRKENRTKAFCESCSSAWMF